MNRCIGLNGATNTMVVIGNVHEFPLNMQICPHKLHSSYTIYKEVLTILKKKNLWLVCYSTHVNLAHIVNSNVLHKNECQLCNFLDSGFSSILWQNVINS